MNLIRRVVSKTSSPRRLCTGRPNGSPSSQQQATCPPTQNTFLFEKLTERCLIRLAGNETGPFLQGLVTNDVGHLHGTTRAIYAMFLNKGGRIIADSLIYKSPEADALLIECDASLVDDLLRHLKMFRVRRKIDVDIISPEFAVWSIHSGTKREITSPPKISEIPGDLKVVVSQDPRLKHLGTRLIAPADSDVKGFFPEDNLQPATADNDYTTLRFRLGVGEGVTDHPPGKALPIESNGDYLHGISFQKGCYLGQELTARSYHTGVIRKRLMPIEIEGSLAADATDKDVKNASDASVGKLRGHKNGHGLALIRIEKVADNPTLKVNGASCTAKRPFWWPDTLPKTKSEMAAATASPTTPET